MFFIVEAFFFALDRNIETVNEFFNLKFSEYSRRLTHLIESYNPSLLAERDIDTQELDDLLSILLELRSLCRNLQWFAEVNKLGFVKILKKLDKKAHVEAQARYLNSEVLVLPFANASSINAKLTMINTFIDEITPLASKHSLIDYTPLQSNTEQIINDTKKKFETRNLSQSSRSSSSNALSDEAVNLRQFLPSDDAILLKQSIAKEKPSNNILLVTLFKAVSFHAFDCIKILLESIVSLHDTTDLNGRNLFHRIVINHARQRADNNKETVSVPDISDIGYKNKFDNQYNQSLYISPAVIPAQSKKLVSDFGKDGVNSNDDVKVLSFICQHIQPSMRDGLIAKDSFKRTPLHYSAQYGLKAITKILLEYQTKWQLVDPVDPFFGNDWKDSDGSIPIELSVKGNHPLTSEVILSSMAKDQVTEVPSLLPIATRLGSEQLVKILLEFGALVNQADNQTNETCLYIASKLNFCNVVKLLLENGADPEISESVYGWTPIFIGAVEGFADVCKALVENGCNVTKTDGSGWNPREHACFRGHLDLLDILKPQEPVTVFFGDKALPSTTESSTSGSTSPENDSDSNPQFQLDLSTINDASVKTFGHRNLANKSMILVNLGSMDMREKSPLIQLHHVPNSKVSSTQLDTALSLIISAPNCEGDPIVVDLPLGEGQNLEQYTFYSDHPENAMIYFDLVPTYSGTKSTILGRAVAIVGELMSKIGNHRSSLFRTITLPILETSTLGVLGTIKFQFLIVNPFHHPKSSVAKSSTYWKLLTTTRVIGHRGLGKNSLSTKSLQLGENTLQSFIAAANLGASYVEFDVQLTKDHVPVIYHDFLVGETGIDIPMHSLTLEQFLNISEQQSNANSGHHLSGKHSKKSQDDLSESLKNRMSSTKNRAMSLFNSTNGEFDYPFNQRMKHTAALKSHGFKANTRGHSIQAPFTTLEEVLKTLPKNVGFNIECKYPMLDESQAENMDNFAIEMNLWVDTVLNTVYDHCDGRDIIFSSFHPEICIMLSLKQPSFPVLFLTEGGTAPMMDIRASSLQEAVRLARRWDLLGIVSECTPLIECPRLVRAVKDSGIVCVTYGAANNDPSNARLQIRNGVDAVIVDSVLAVRNGLTEDSNKQ